MTLEEAVQWCQEKRATVSFWQGGVAVSIPSREPTSFTDPRDPVTYSRGKSLEEAVRKLRVMERVTEECIGGTR